MLLLHNSLTRTKVYSVTVVLRAVHKLLNRLEFNMIHSRVFFSKHLQLAISKLFRSTCRNTNEPSEGR